MKLHNYKLSTKMFIVCMISRNLYAHKKCCKSHYYHESLAIYGYKHMMRVCDYLFFLIFPFLSRHQYTSWEHWQPWRCDWTTRVRDKTERASKCSQPNAVKVHQAFRYHRCFQVHPCSGWWSNWNIWFPVFTRRVTAWWTHHCDDPTLRSCAWRWKPGSCPLFGKRSDRYVFFFILLDSVVRI